ncbi:MAG: O-antigen ligase family protein [Chloroflexia bacterium]
MSATTGRSASSKQASDEWLSSHESIRPAVESRLSILTSHLLFGALLLVIALSPFEAGYPPLGRFAIGESLGMTFTNLEVLLFLLGGAWVLRLVFTPDARRRLLHLPLLLPILGLVAAAVLSTIFGEFKSLGVQFIYRLLMGVLVYAAVWEALRGTGRLVAALGTLVGAGAVASIIGLMEFAPAINIQPWLKAFKPQPTTVGGMLRLSGSFEYANGAAMYFEMALPVVIGLVILFSSRRLVDEIFEGGQFPERLRRVIQILLFGTVGKLTMALVLTYSRAAWTGVVVAVGVIALAVLVRKRDGPQYVTRAILPPLAASIIVMTLAAAYIAVTQPLLVLRLTAGENDRSWYKNSIVPDTLPALAAGEVVTVPVMLRNEGPMTWQAERVPSVNLSYHWKNSGEGEDSAFYAVFEGERTSLPHDVAPGESVIVEAIVQAPPEPGDYLLEWDLVQERVAWFYEKTKTRIEPTPHRVDEATAGQQRPPLGSPNQRQVSVEQMENSDTSTVPRTKLWSAAFAMFRDHPITGVGPDGFRNLYGKYAGVTQWSKNIYTNNTYIEMFTNLGLIGGLAFLLIVGLAIWRSVRNILREPVDALWVVTVGMTAGLAAFFFHGFLDYFLFSTPIYIIFWFAMAVSVFWPRLVSPSGITNYELRIRESYSIRNS